MVWLSGLSFSLSKGGKNGDYILYLWSRFKRLVVPTWMFLCVYFALFNLLGERYECTTYIRSYALLDGIGYVWVIRIYFLMAMIAPFCWNLRHKLGVKNFLLLVAVIFVSYQIAYMIYSASSYQAHGMMWLFMQVIPYTIGYGLAFALGMCIKQIKDKSIVLIGYSLLLVFIILFLINGFSGNGFSEPQSAKYPPQMYYVFYGLTATLILYRIKENQCVRWICKNSLWIYFWHIVPLGLIGDEIVCLPFDNFVVRYVFVTGTGTAMLLTILHNGFLRDAKKKELYRKKIVYT